MYQISLNSLSFGFRCREEPLKPWYLTFLHRNVTLKHHSKRLTCSSFSRKNGCPLLVCSSLSTAQLINNIITSSEPHCYNQSSNPPPASGDTNNGCLRKKNIQQQRGNGAFTFWKLMPWDRDWHLPFQWSNGILVEEIRILVSSIRLFQRGTERY